MSRFALTPAWDDQDHFPNLRTEQRGLSISRITDGKGQQVTQFTKLRGSFGVTQFHERHLVKGQPQTLTFEYDGRLTGNEESPIYGIKFAAITPEVSLFLLYPARWFPVSGYTSDRFTATINVTAPPGYTVVGNVPSTHPSFPGDIKPCCAASR